MTRGTGERNRKRDKNEACNKIKNLFNTKMDIGRTFTMSADNRWIKNGYQGMEVEQKEGQKLNGATSWHKENGKPNMARKTKDRKACNKSAEGYSML